MNDNALTHALELAGIRSVPPVKIYAKVSVTPVLLACAVPDADHAVGQEIAFTEAASIHGQRMLPASDAVDKWQGAFRGFTVYAPSGMSNADLNLLRESCEIVIRTSGIDIPVPLVAALEVAHGPGNSAVTQGTGAGLADASGVGGGDEAPGEPAFILPAAVAWASQSGNSTNGVFLRFNSATLASVQEAAARLFMLVWFAGARKSDTDAGKDISENGYQFGDVACTDHAVTTRAIRAVLTAKAQGISADQAIRSAKRFR